MKFLTSIHLPFALRKIKANIWFLLKLLKFYIRKHKTKKYINAKQDNIKNIKLDDILLILVIKDEAHRLPSFLKYYRELGIDHFLIIDNLSSDNLKDTVKGCKDISIFETAQLYQNSKYGVDWVNYIAYKYCLNHWTLTVDTDEYLVYPNVEDRNLKELTAHLESTNQNKFFTLLLDMYSKEGVTNVVHSPSDDPIKKCNYFDKIGYFQKKNYYQGTHIIGGPRLRVFNRDNTQASPALNKTPLIRWKFGLFYYLSTHVIIPKSYNAFSSKNNFNVTTGALLHFKFFDDIKLKSNHALENLNHFNNSAEYKKYNEAFSENSNEINLYCDGVSVKYKNSKTLLDYGLMQTGEFIE